MDPKIGSSNNQNIDALISHPIGQLVELDPESVIEEVRESAWKRLGEQVLDTFLCKKDRNFKRNQAEQAILLHELNAKAFALTKDVAVKGIRVETGKGYYATIGAACSEKIDDILQRIYHPRKYKQLENHLFIPEKIAVDLNDMESEIPEVIHGILMHEIGEVKYNDWKQFILRQYHIEQKSIKGEMGKGWGKDYAYFINGVGDPRINNLVSKDSPEAKVDIVYAELSGILGLIDSLSGLPRHVQFLLLANCRDAEDYASDIVALLLRQADSVAVHYYHKNKRLLAEIAQAEEINEFYRLANQLWSEYVKSIVDLEKRNVEDYESLTNMLPISPQTGAVIDKHNGVVIPLPEGIDNKMRIHPQYRRVDQNDTGTKHRENGDIDKKRSLEIQQKLDQLRDSRQNSKFWRDGRVGNQEGKIRRKNSAKIRQQSSNYQKRFSGKIRDLCSRFANSVNEFTPMSASSVIKRQNRGSLSVRSYINTQGKRQDIYNRVSRFMKHYALFSIIIDTSGSMQESAGNARSKISYTKDAAYSLCDGLAQKKIPFELLSYGSFSNCDSNECWNPIEIIHSIENLSDFSVEERNRLAFIKADGGQSDVVALESSANRLFKMAGHLECIPFFLMICDGCTGIELKHTVKKVRQSGGVVVGVGIRLSAGDKEEFKINFENHGIFVDDMNQLVPTITSKLVIERNRILIWN